ncbi:allantoinase, partial [Rhizobium leguminosarum]
MDFDLVLQGSVVLPDRILDEGYVALRDGNIASVGLGVPPAGRERPLLGKAL